MGALACILSCYVKDITLLTITQGLAVGTASGMFNFPGTLMVSNYFDKKRPLAYGLAVTGISLGACITAPLISYILSQEGRDFRTVFYCQAAIIGCCGVLGCLLFPPVKRSEDSTSSTETSVTNPLEILLKLTQNRGFFIYFLEWLWSISH